MYLKRGRTRNAVFNHDISGSIQCKFEQLDMLYKAGIK